jgi:tetratricopeptide (TPR) repeat protein
MAMGEVDDSKTWCELALFWRPEKDNVLQVASDCFSMCGEPAKAVELLNKLLAAYPDDAIAWFKTGNAMTALGQLPDAIKCYDQAIENAPRTTAVWSDRERLRGVFVSVKPNQVSVEAWNGKGLALKAIGRPAEALACYEKALAIDPRKSDVWCNKGSALYAQGRVEEALVCLEEATSVNPRDFKSWCNQGVMLKALGRLREAVCCYDKALEINPRDIMTWGNRGNVFGALGQLDEARKCFERILVLDPNNTAARSVIEQLRHAGS